MKDVESIINDWKTDVVEPIIKVNDLDKITNSALQLSKILYHDDLDLEKNLHDIRILQRELNDKVKERSKKEIVNRPTQIIEIINEFMFKEKEFRSNIHDYQNPMNNFLNVVLQKKIGIPITLSIIYISLGNSINFRLYPINFPGHFLVKHILDENRNEIIIDPFNQGRIMDDYSLKNILDRFFPYQKILVTKSLLEKTTLSYVIIRLLNNLKESFFEIQEFERLNIANEMILSIEPQNSHAIRDKGIILYNENPQKAEELLIKYLELEPEANDADSILNTIKNLRGRKDF
ncbi:MAG TPA: transglutaminase-like domain-containing protein [Nitrososphaeraceae archaeon]|nr:transglutaminase-like domain-containing protein [Nitrososphaeraceae archaeon]